MATTAPAPLREPLRRRRALPRVRQIVAGTDGLGPALIVALALAGLIAAGLTAEHGNPLAFVRFGSQFAGVIHPPRDAVVYPGSGYDGQYFWALATDPLLLHGRSLTAFSPQSFRLQRIAYPALAWLLAGGRRSALGWSLLAVNLVIVLAATAGFGLYARRRGWSGWWALAVGLLPGLTYAVIGDLSDALATTALLAGLIAWRHQRLGPAAILLAIACLARESMVLAVAAVVGETLLAARRGASGRRAVGRELLIAPILVPLLTFGAWQIYIHLRLGTSTSPPWTAFSAPFAQILAEVRHALEARRAIDGTWGLLYLGAMLVGIGLSIRHAWRHPTAPALAAALFGLTLPVLVFGGAWSYARLSAPMLVCLLLVGLERRDGSTLAVCAGVACLGALVPLSIG